MKTDVLKLENIATNIKTEASAITLNQILSKKMAMDELVAHLFTEYSIECLVSFIEIEQYQKWIMDNDFDVTTKDVHHKPLNNVKLIDAHDDIPQSLMFENISSDSDDLLQSAKLMAFKLYQKYIEHGSELEINISSALRKQLKNIVSDKQKLMENINVSLNELLLLFDKPKNEMRLLLNYSHTRFKQKTEYTKIVGMFANTPTSHLRRVSISIVNNL
eukprot:CAMPEP_0201596104 /NCGR_PEP_ID=MMETSP0190_2-20130828/192893_1 /ASSEMBLY_ACC=CAM_ASM_000263 /TAXON_ID=37353 /ORGANISM="Rosalina sp." /LENGTH=217 /DNA_ID=CAMNT_0048056329 /DNA_START=884 /DNA_END=1537 /DNA_ORIENTATION=-